MIKRKNILLVEDDKEISNYIVEQLSYLELNIMAVHFVSQAIDLLENGLEPSFIISDYSMPFGNGDMLLEYLFKKHYSTPFVFFTHSILLDDYKKYENFLGTISKFEIKKLKKLLEMNFKKEF